MRAASHIRPDDCRLNMLDFTATYTARNPMLTRPRFNVRHTHM